MTSAETIVTYRSPLHKMTQTTPTVLWNDSAAIDELTTRAVAAGTVSPGVTAEDVMALVLAMRGLAQASGEVEPAAWRRFLDIHLAGLRAAPPASRRPRNPAGFRPVRSN